MKPIKESNKLAVMISIIGCSLISLQGVTFIQEFDKTYNNAIPVVPNTTPTSPKLIIDLPLNHNDGPVTDSPVATDTLEIGAAKRTMVQTPRLKGKLFRRSLNLHRNPSFG